MIRGYIVFNSFLKKRVEKTKIELQCFESLQKDVEKHAAILIIYNIKKHLKTKKQRAKIIKERILLEAAEKERKRLADLEMKKRKRQSKYGK